MESAICTFATPSKLLVVYSHTVRIRTPVYLLDTWTPIEINESTITRQAPVGKEVKINVKYSNIEPVELLISTCNGQDR